MTNLSHQQAGVRLALTHSLTDSFDIDSFFSSGSIRYSFHRADIALPVSWCHRPMCAWAIDYDDSAELRSLVFHSLKYDVMGERATGSA